MKYSITISLFILFGLILSTFNLEAQTAEFPFAQNRTFSHGFMPTTITERHAHTGYEEFMSRYYRECTRDNSARIIEPSRNNRTVSEGIGYGMLIAAYYGDKEKFDKLWRYYKNRRNARGVMHWEYSDCDNQVGTNGATDGDLDAAMALVIANCQWPNSTSPFNYESDATALISAIKDHEFTTCNGLIVQKPGDAFGGCTCTNPSYFSPGYYRAFAQFVPAQADFWTKAANDSYVTLLANANSNTGLVSAWTNSTGGLPSNCGVAEGGGGGADTYQYDASRTPWRIAVDYLWWGTPEAGEWLKKLTNWVKTPATSQGSWTGGGGIANIRDGYYKDGRQAAQWRNSAFTGAFALASMASSQEDANSFHDWWMKNSVTSGTPGTGQLDDRPYYQHSLKVLYMFLSSGNFWFPCSGGTVCHVPDLGEDISICGTSSVTLNSGVERGDGIRFTWRRGNTLLIENSADANTYVADRAGTYSVTVIAEGCSETDEINVSGDLISPFWGEQKELCDPAVIALTPQNLSSFPNGTTWQWQKDGLDIPGQTTSTLENVRKAGVYSLKASVSGCASTIGSVEVTSNLPSPVDGCRSSAGSVQLSVEGGTGPFTWYGSSSSENILGTGSTFTTPSISSSTTYYVEQGGISVSGTVGPASRSTSGWNGAIADYTDNKIRFNAQTSFTLSSVVVYPMNNQDITVRVLNSGGEIVASKTLENVPGGSAQTLDLGFKIPEGNGYVMDALGTNGQLWMDGTGAGRSYPYSLEGVVTITGTLPEWAAGNGWWFYFYNWNVSTGSGCARIPVEAKIDTGCDDACQEPGNAGTISGEREVCSGAGGMVYSIPEVAGATSYEWVVSGGASITNGQGTRTITVSFEDTDGEIAVTPVNECGEGLNSRLAIKVLNVPSKPGAITGKNEVCNGESNVRFSIASVSGATSYEWTVPDGASISSGQGSSNIIVDFGSSNGEVSVKAINDCGESSSSVLQVGIVSSPTAPNVGDDKYITTSSSTLTASSTTSGTWSLVSGSGNITSPNSLSTAVSGLGMGANFFRFTVNTDCGSAYDEVVINVGSVPQIGSVTGSQAVESGQTYTYSVESIEGVDYVWAVPEGAIIERGQGTNSIDVRFGANSSGSVMVEATNIYGASNAELVISVGGAPAIGSNITGTKFPVVGERYTYRVPEIEGANYSWNVPAGATIVSGQGTHELVLEFEEGVSGNISVEASNANGSSSASISITSGYTPEAVIIEGTSEVEAGVEYTYTVPQQVGVTYNWSIPLGASIVNGVGSNSLTVVYGENVQGTIKLEMSNNYGSTQTSIPVQTIGAEEFAISAPEEMEVGRTYTLKVPHSPGAEFYWEVPEGMVILDGQGTNEIIVEVRSEVQGEVTVRENTSSGETRESSINIVINRSTNVSEAFIKDSFSLYPNPSSDNAILKVNTASQLNLNIIITDARGAILRVLDDVSSNEDITIGEGYPSGIYFVQVFYEGKVRVLKLVRL